MASAPSRPSGQARKNHKGRPLPLPCPYPPNCANNLWGVRPENIFLVLNSCKGGIVLTRGLLTLTFRACWWQPQLADRTQGRWKSKSLPPLVVLLGFALFKPCRPYRSALATPNWLYADVCRVRRPSKSRELGSRTQVGLGTSTWSDPSTWSKRLDKETGLYSCQAG